MLEFGHEPNGCVGAYTQAEMYHSHSFFFFGTQLQRHRFTVRLRVGKPIMQSCHPHPEFKVRVRVYNGRCSSHRVNTGKHRPTGMGQYSLLMRGAVMSCKHVDVSLGHAI